MDRAGAEKWLRKVRDLQRGGSEKFHCRSCGGTYYCNEYYQPCKLCGAPWENTHVLLFQER